MKLKYLLFSMCTFGLISCIQNEPLDREADIDDLEIQDTSFIKSNISADMITFTVKNGTDIRHLAPVIKLSNGAKITPASGTPLDFTKDVVYTVTSENGEYVKRYKVSVDFPPIHIKYDFENWDVVGEVWKYPQYTDLSWSSGNTGVMVAFFGRVKQYPTRPTTDAHSGEHAALLETIKGKKIVFVGNIPIFSGSFFTGDFKADMSNPLKSTRFGQIHPKESGKPTNFSGYYKYKPGEKFINKDNKEIVGRVDKCSIYAVLFKVTKGEAGRSEYLDGINILTSDKVVATAIWDDSTPKDEYTQFSVPFKYIEEPDYNTYDYKLALVFASSKDGDRYEGAIGSQLIVDDVEVTCEEIID